MWSGISVILIFSLLMNTNVEHHFMWLVAICISSLKICIQICGRLNNALPLSRKVKSFLLTCECYIIAKETLQKEGVKLRILWWRDYSGSSAWVKCNQQVFIGRIVTLRERIWWQSKGWTDALWKKKDLLAKKFRCFETAKTRQEYWFSHELSGTTLSRYWIYSS